MKVEFLFLFWVAWSEPSLTPSTGTRLTKDLADLVEHVAHRYFFDDCINFLFVNPLPDLVRSNLLARLQRWWSVFLPCDAPKNELLDSDQPPGIWIHLRCSTIVPIRGADNYTTQVKEILYQTWNTFYSEEATGSVTTDRIIIAIDEEINHDKAYSLLSEMAALGDVDSVLIGPERGNICILSYFPFGLDGKSCPEDNKGLVIHNLWGRDLFPNKIPRKFQGCTLPVTAVEYKPFLFKKDGHFLGIDYHILEIVADHLNMTSKVKYYTRQNGWHFNGSKANEFLGSLYDLRTGLAWLHLTKITNNPFHYPSVHIPNSYAYYHMCWYCPNPLPVASWKLLYLAFSTFLWCSFGLMIIFFPMLIFLFNNRGTKDKHYNDFSQCMLSCWCAALGNSTGTLPKTNILRFLFALWLIYTTHVNIAYNASLTGLLSGGLMETKVASVDDMIQKQFTSVANLYYRTTIPLIEDSSLSTLLKTVVYTDDANWAIGNLIHYRNSCYIDSDIFLNYLIVSNKTPIYQTPVSLYSSRGMGIAMRRNHFLNGIVDRIVQILLSGGINEKFIKYYTKSLWDLESTVELKAVKFTTLTGSFYLLALGLIASLTVFICELVHAKFN